MFGTREGGRDVGAQVIDRKRPREGRGPWIGDIDTARKSLNGEREGPEMLRLKSAKTLWVEVDLAQLLR